MLAAGMLIVVLAIGVVGDVAPTVLAGNTCVTPTPVTPVGEIQAEGASLQQLPTCTPTTVPRLKTHTPTSTATVATSTAVPATPAPVNTQAPAPTQPGGGTEGVGVKPPNTGSGPSGGSSTGLWLLLGGIAVAATGAGSVLVGARRRGRSLQDQA
jgi:hypothetical protein